MNHPPPHSFSRSPVEEVFCRCTCGSDAESLSLSIPSPYPGWLHIRDKIRDIIAGAGEITLITGCMLQYTDLIPVVSGKFVPGTEDIARLISGRFKCFIDNTKDEIVLFSTGIPNTAGSVASIWNRPGKPGWTLIFTMKTENPPGFVSGDAILNWFDDARAGIHETFDRIVPEEIVQALR